MNNNSILDLSVEAGTEPSASERNRFSLTRPRRCRQCGKDVSRTIKRCPNCGQPLSARPQAD